MGAWAVEWVGGAYEPEPILVRLLPFAIRSKKVLSMVGALRGVRFCCPSGRSMSPVASNDIAACGTALPKMRSRGSAIVSAIK